MAHRLLFLNETWRVVTQLTDAQKYTSVCAVFVDLLARYYTERELLVVLKGARALQLVLTACFSGLLVFAHSHFFLSLFFLLFFFLINRRPKDLARHISASSASDPIVMSNLEKVVGVVTQNHGSEIGEVLTSQHFMAVLDLFQGIKKSALCKKMLTRFVQLPGTTDDVVVIQTMFDLTRTLHDSIDSLSFDDERRQVRTRIVQCTAETFRANPQLTI